MKQATEMIRELRVASQLGARALKRRLSGRISSEPDQTTFRNAFSALLKQLPANLIESHRFIELPATRPPWLKTALKLRTDDAVSSFACGRTYLSRPLDLWVEPSFQLWMRIGNDGEVFRGTRASHGFTADRDGELQLASYFPGEWANRDGTLATPIKDYRKVGGGMCVLLIRWQAGVTPQKGLEALLALGDVQELIAAELDRLRQPVVAPEGWSHLWFLGPSEIYCRCEDESKAGAICCHTERDVAILQHDADLPLTEDVALQWSWKVDALPSDLREDTLPTHDYLSIAVEFDNGRDLSYLWSSQLPAGRHFRCPLPTWQARETHWVVRSGSTELGRWLEESRNVFEDYRIAIGGPLPQRIVRVWLIANSLFQRRPGRAAYADIRFRRGEETLSIT